MYVAIKVNAISLGGAIKTKIAVHYLAELIVIAGNMNVLIPYF